MWHCLYIGAQVHYHGRMSKDAFPSTSRTSVELIGFDRSMLGDRLGNLGHVLFLDIDGVMHPESCGTDIYFCFGPQFADTIRAVDPSGVMPIVISSNWRYTDTLDSIRANFPADIGARIIGVTPDLLDVPIPSSVGRGSGGASNGGCRQREIKAWLNAFAPAAAWLAIDDRPSYFSKDCRNLFVVPGLYAENGGGLNSFFSDSLRLRLMEFLSGNHSEGIQF